MKMILLITSKIEGGMDVALAWQEAGAPGVSVFRGHGLHSLRESTKRGSIELPLHITSMASILAYAINEVEHTNNLLLSVVDDDLVPGMIESANRILGDLTSPRTGVIFVVDVEQAIGVRDPSSDGSED